MLFEPLSQGLAKLLQISDLDLATNRLATTVAALERDWRQPDGRPRRLRVPAKPRPRLGLAPQSSDRGTPVVLRVAQGDRTLHQDPRTAKAGG